MDSRECGHGDRFSWPFGKKSYIPDPVAFYLRPTALFYEDSYAFDDGFSCQRITSDTGMFSKFIPINSLTLSSNYRSLMDQITQSDINICLTGSGLSDDIIPSRSQWIRDAVLLWIAPLRTQAPQIALASRINVGTAFCGNSHLTVDISNDESLRANVRPTTQNIPVMHIHGRDSWGGNYTTIIHEMGHAFGMDDTYIENVWSCKTNQPDSVMCKGGRTTLAMDDILGIRFRLFAQYPIRKSPHRFLYAIQNDTLWKINPADGSYSVLGARGDWHQTRAMTS